MGSVMGLAGHCEFTTAQCPETRTLNLPLHSVLKLKQSKEAQTQTEADLTNPISNNLQLPRAKFRKSV